MNLSAEYIAVVINSTIRLMAPILLVTLTAVICSRVDTAHIAYEGIMLSGAFFGIAVNYYTHNVWLAVLAAGLSGCVISFVVAFFIVKLKAYSLVVGISMNTFMVGTTTFLMTVVFGSKGVFQDPSLHGIPKITLPLISKIPILGTIFSSLTVLDYGAFLIAIVLYVFLFKTVPGYRLRAVGVNREAARSLGTNVDRFRITAVTLSGFLAGIGGSLLTLGSVVVFAQNITSGRGYIALVADSLGRSHPLGVIAACILFGFAEAVGNILQMNTSIKQQLTLAIPYLVTLLALIFQNIRIKHARNKHHAPLECAEIKEGKETNNDREV